MNQNRIWLWIVSVLLLAGCGRSNEPVPKQWLAENTLFTSYQETPKHLDPASSYSNNETPWTYAVYEPPLKYHYLKRPYELLPRTLTSLPKVTYISAEGKPLPPDAPAALIAESWFDLELKPGVLWQPHPAFARDAKGDLRYHRLTERELRDKNKPADFSETGTRSLLAQDYAYAIKRLATTRVKSPAFGFLSEKIVGLQALGETIKQHDQGLKQGLHARQAGVFGELPWIDFRNFELEGVEVLSDLKLRIRVIGKYPQFKYWLAMSFFAPVAWEVDAFYSQAGMSRRNLNLDTWPVGTGPYQLTEFVPNARMVLERNPNYRGEPYPCEGEPDDVEQGFLKDCGRTTPFIDRMVSFIEKEGTSVHAKFMQGYYDVPQLERGEPGVGYQVSIEDGSGVARLLKDRKIQLPNTIQVGFWYFGFNWLDPVVGAGRTPEEAERNRKLRHAFSIAFDIEEYIAIFEDNRAQANMSPVVRGVFGGDLIRTNPVVYNEASGQVRRRSIEEAKRLLAEAGYPEGRDRITGRPLVINYDVQGVGPGYQARLDWVARQFAKLNVQLEVRNTDYNRFQDKMRKGAAQFFFWGWLADYPDPENFLFLLYGPNAKAKSDGENAGNYSSAAFDKLFEQMKDLDDGPQRAALIAQMVRIVQTDAPMIFGWSEEYAGAYHQWLYNGKPS
ncbi:MAG: peptide ABC transporter substrate-binding protein, partial [Betaproteobacteria bacterium]|nr:peptide ABC transporter substrate-binding protein [Betaproteobacteria bacterium]